MTPGEMPGRPRQHELETLSRRSLEAALPPELVYRTSTDDYGLDGEIEVFEQNLATGLRFNVQLKATDEADLDKALKVRIKHSQAAYFRSQLAPVLMVRYLASTGDLYARWFHEFDPYDEHVGKDALTYHWYAANRWDADTPANVVAQARAVIEARAVTIELPVTCDVTVGADAVHGFSRSEIELAVQGQLDGLAGLIRAEEAAQDARLRLSVTEEAISANLSSISSSTFHLDEGFYESEESADQIALDLLASAVIAFTRAGRADIATRLAVRCYPSSTLAAFPPLGGEIAAAAIYAGRVSDLLDISDQLDESSEDVVKVTSGVMKGAVETTPINHLSEQDQRRLRRTLETRLAQREEAGKEHEIAAAAGNLGTHLHAVNLQAEAIPHLRRAIELSPQLAREHSYWRALAGACFLSQDYEGALEAYTKVLEEEGSEEAKPQTEALRADSLMLLGRYAEAQEAFKAIEPHTDTLHAWVFLKVRVLRWVIHRTGIEQQTRAVAEAVELAGSRAFASEVPDESFWRKVWALDALCQVGWFNTARDLLDSGEEGDAMHSYLTAAVVAEQDVEAWVNVVILASGLEPSLVVPVSVSGHRLNRKHEAFMVELARQLRSIPDPAGREAVLSGVRKVIEEFERRDEAASGRDLASSEGEAPAEDAPEAESESDAPAEDAAGEDSDGD